MISNSWTSQLFTLPWLSGWKETGGVQTQRTQFWSICINSRHFIHAHTLLELFDGIEKVFKDRTHRLCPSAGHLLIMSELSLLATLILCPLWNHTWWQGKQGRLFLIRIDFDVICHICVVSFYNITGKQLRCTRTNPLLSLVTTIKITTYEQPRRSNRGSAARSGDERQDWTWRSTRPSRREPCQRV